MKIKLLLCLAFLSAGIILKAQVPAYVASNGLTAYWPFNNTNNANDLVASYMSAFYPPNTPPSLGNDRFGNAGNAYSFNGSNWIETPYKGILGDSARAVSFWAKTPGNGGAGMYLVGWGGNYIGDRFGCSLDYPPNKVAVGGANCSQIFSSPSSFSINQWHHYIFQFGPQFGNTLSDVKVWVDAVQIFTTSLNAYNPFCPLYTVNNFNVTFGKIIYPQGPCFYNGSLDEIGIWKRILTQCEISKLFYANANIGAMSFNPSGYSGSLINLAQYTQTLSGNNQFSIPIAGSAFSGTGVSLSGGQYNFNLPATLPPGTYTITHTYTLQGGCVQVSTGVVTLKGEVGLQDINSTGPERFALFPNPAQSNVSILSTTENENLNIRILDATGKMVLNQNIIAGKTEGIDVSHFENGFYFAEIRNESEKTIYKKVVIDRH